MRNDDVDDFDALSGREIQELRRMLAAFRSDLPQHELGYWRITRQPVATVVENESPPNVMYLGDTGDRVLIRGHGICVRCRRQFDIPNYGNFTAYTEDDVARTVASAKEWVQRDAIRAGPCWGEVPLAPENSGGFAVEDTA